MARRSRSNTVLGAAALTHSAVVAATWRDIGNRPASQVRGPKALWRTASSLNTLGAVAYWVFGRR